MSSPSTSPSRSPPSLDQLLTRTLAHLDRLLVLAAVPLVTSLLNVSDLLATAQTRGMSVTASFPVYRYDLWSFVDAPDDGGLTVSVPFGTVESIALVIPLLVAYVIVSGALSAGYFGSIASGLTTGSFDFVANVRRFGLRMIALEVLVIAALLVVFLPLLVVPPLFVLAILAVLVLAYFLFPTVYVLVLEDRGIESALRRGYDLVTTHQPIVVFLAIVVATLMCSVPLSSWRIRGSVARSWPHSSPHPSGSRSTSRPW
ncbi:hypothetical protein AArcSl_2928 [Halalkaliarchaeum desulfuricum]|uniref:Uncharacterized protein n=1 Tax=Halalkaliarchaeum desulfuricum TaxID=2055893 RepID=A0A343TN67_9EURY|nr:hypothetical protein AArcSl_2928 [Halalkaliarchaeum desulfuricum]